MLHVKISVFALAAPSTPAVKVLRGTSTAITGGITPSATGLILINYIMLPMIGMSETFDGPHVKVFDVCRNTFKVTAGNSITIMCSSRQ